MVLRIFLRDIKRLLRNPVALIVTLGVAIIPSLYAWLNILANWDPYKNTSTIPIAVVNEDSGGTVEAMGTINVGDMVVEKLKENTQLQWTFVDEDKALDGVKSGTYYAAFVMPEDFTSSLTDVLDGNVEQAHIAYYVNEKVNAVAPKVTDTGATTLETQIDDTFVNTVAKVVAEKLQAGAANAASEADNAVISTLKDVRDVQAQLKKLEETLSGTQESVSDARDTIRQANTTVSALSRTASGASSTLSSALGTLETSRSRTRALTTSLASALAEGSGNLANLSTSASYDLSLISNRIGDAQGTIDAALATAGDALDGAQDLKSQLDEVKSRVDALPDGEIKEQLQSTIAAVDTALSDRLDAQNALLSQLEATAQSTKDDADAIRKLAEPVNQAIKDGSVGLTDAQQLLISTTQPDVDNVLDQVSQTGSALVATTNAVPTSLSQASSALDQLDSVLAQTSTAISSTRDNLKTTNDSLSALTDDISAIQSSETMDTIKDLLDINPEQIGSFMGSPVEMETEALFPVANYGSGVTPFYTNLALWVGGFVLVAIYKLEVDQEDVGEFKPWQGYLGRWLLLNLIGILQALICCIGDLVLGIQCVSPAAFVFAGLIESFVYVGFIYALSVAFKHIGKALGVLLVVLQIPGSSGTYPIQMMPGFFQALYPWLPFTYGINAMREAIGGFYGSYYAYNIMMLLILVPVSLLVGLGARRHLLNLNALFDRELSETDLMIGERIGMDEAHFKLSTIIKALANSKEYQQTFQERVASFELHYPILVRRGFLALLIAPVALTVLLFVLPYKMLLLVLWVLSLLITCTFLLVVEYFHARVAEKTSLANKSQDELYDLLGSSLKQEFFAFAPIEAMLHEHGGVLGRLHSLAERDRDGSAAPAQEQPADADANAPDKAEDDRSDITRLLSQPRPPRDTRSSAATTGTDGGKEDSDE